MHPDAIIAGLRRELERLDRDAEDYLERKDAIEAEVKRTDGLDRPEATAEAPDTVADHNVGYLAGLKRELERIGEHEHDRLEQIRAEIKRVEALVHKTAPEAPEVPEVKVPEDPPAADGLEEKTRAELNELAAGLGIENPDKLPNKSAVVDAIREANQAANG